MRIRSWLGIGVALIAVMVLIGAEPGPNVRLVPNPPTVTPSYQRVELAGGEDRTLTLTLSSDHLVTLLAINTDCRCVSGQETLPLALAANTATPVRLRITGAVPGLKNIRLMTTAGTIPVQVQIISDGLGTGADSVRAFLDKARRDAVVRVVMVLHDLHGERRNCGCSGGSLGGMDHLAALPAWVQGLADPLSVEALMSGDVEGDGFGGMTEALMQAGWRAAGDAIVITSDPTSALLERGALAVIPTGATSLQNERLLRPLLDRGMAVEFLGIDLKGRIRVRQTVPIDRSLPADATIWTRLPPEPLQPITSNRSPSLDCRACHASAHAVWAASAHASACDRLTAPDHTARCLTCHTTPPRESGTPLVAHVQCQACHLGADAHAAVPHQVRTSGTVSCRSCHDAQHHPGFDPEAAWKAILHGR